MANYGWHRQRMRDGSSRATYHWPQGWHRSEMEASDKVSHAVKSIELCLESRQLLVAGMSGQVTLFRFSKTENMNSIAVVNIPLLGNPSTSWASGPGLTGDEKTNGPAGASKEIRRQRKVMSRDSTNSFDTSDSGDERIVPFKVRGAPVKRPPGFQPELACFIPWPSHAKVDNLTSIALNSAYGVIALGTSSGLALVDITQCALIYAWTSSELYGSEPTPAIQLNSQFGDAPSPVESPEEPRSGRATPASPIPTPTITTKATLSTSVTVKLSNGLLTAGETTSIARCKSMNNGKGSGIGGIFRRNTAELAATIRERYSHPTAQLTPDRPDVEPPPSRGQTPPPTPNEAETVKARSHSVKGSIMRRFTKGSSTKEKPTMSLSRSRSFHSNISEEGEQGSYLSPSSLEPPRSSLVRLNTDVKQKSFESRRPQLFKTQSVIEHTNGGSPRGENSPGLSRAGNGSPSTSSLERAMAPPVNESVTSLQFIHSHSRRNDAKMAPCLWVGTSAGTTIALNLILPEDRFVSTVVVAPSGTVVKLKGQVLYQTFMDSSFCLVSAAVESYKETSRESKDTNSPERSLTNRTLTKGSLAPQYSNSIDVNDEISQVLVVVAEMEVKVIALPSFSQLFVHKCDEIPLVKAKATHVRGFPVLMCLSAAGQMVVLSLPSLRLLHTSALLPHSVEIEDS
ncbi:unnamed protein product [Caenorhabditis auriculariae]|uniref:Lethal giant larvae (Lgl)-like C-terminal domain-containing protein n=1 Tax=Caenorhabditis auriculariae TaxID=2777116 RepID=A0A8S1GQB1_9PELO|nr:unnamed protein product [Caenorhabditis auriculariae]